MRAICIRLLTLFILVSVLPGCKMAPQLNLDSLELHDSQGNFVQVKNFKGKKATAFLFLSPDCPLCINVSKTINEMAIRYGSKGISFIAVFPGTFYTADTINNFKSQYQIQLTALMDEEFQLTKMMHATVTPQVVVINTDEQIVYTGAIDDRSKKLGEKRQVIQNHYLENVLDAMLSDKDIAVKETEPVGCYIEFE